LLIGLIRLSRVLGLELLSRGVALDAVLHDLESLNWLLLLLDELMLTTCDAFCFLVGFASFLTGLSLMSLLSKVTLAVFSDLRQVLFR